MEVWNLIRLWMKLTKIFFFRFVSFGKLNFIALHMNDEIWNGISDERILVTVYLGTGLYRRGSNVAAAEEKPCAKQWKKVKHNRGKRKFLFAYEIFSFFFLLLFAYSMTSVHRHFGILLYLLLFLLPFLILQFVGRK